jgi:phosphoglycerate dehydrogenase-like enzyme
MEDDCKKQLTRVALLKQSAIFINVGRGDLISSSELLAALDHSINPLFGAAIDVTDPEPLPDRHPLWTHDRCIVTPHASGDTEGEFEIATDIAIENARRIRAGEEVLNRVDLVRGY